MQPGKSPGETRGAPPTGWRALADSPRALRGFLLGNAVGDLGNGFFRLALPWIVYDLTHSAAAMGVLAALAYVPSLFIPWMGRLVDRTSVRPVLVAAIGLQVVTLGGLGALLTAHAVTLAMVDAAAVLATAGNLLAWAAMQVVVQRLTPAHARLAVNGFTSILFNGSWYLSPALAGLVIGHWGVAAALYCNAAGLVAVLIPVAWLPVLRPVGLEPASLKASWRVFVKAREVVAATGVFGFWGFTWGAVYALEVFFFRHQLNLGATMVGVVGMLAGVVPLALAVLGPYIVARFTLLALLSGSLLLSGLGMMGLAVSHTWYEATLAIGAVDGAASPVGIVVSTLAQQAIPAGWYGQVAAWQMLVETVGVPLASVAAGAAAAAVGAPTAIGLAGMLTVAVGGLIPGTPLTRLLPNRRQEIKTPDGNEVESPPRQGS